MDIDSLEMKKNKRRNKVREIKRRTRRDTEGLASRPKRTKEDY